MNRTYKVAKSLTRGVVVTSEKASSYQGKAVKTVIALAVASLVGSVGATALTGPVEHVTISSDQTTEVTTSVVGKWGEGDAADYTANTSTVTVDGGKLTITGNSAGLNVGGVAIKSGTVILTGDADSWDLNASTEGNHVPKAQTNLGGYDSFEMTGGDVTLKNARLWIGSVDKKTYNTMTLSGGTLSLDNGGITGLSNNTDNTVTGNTIALSGVELNAVKGDKNVVNSLNVEMSAGSINVAKDAALQISTYTRDGNDWNSAYSTLGGKVNFTGGTVVNKGTLNVQALKTTIDGTSFDNQGTLSFGPLSGSATGDLTIKSGSISNAEGAELTVVDATVTGGQVTNAGALTATTLTVQGGKVENAGKGVLDADTITIEKNGVLNTTYTKDTFKWKEITVADNGVLNLDALNSRHDGQKIGSKDKDGNVLAGDRLLINAGTINLEGGELQVAGTKYEGDLKIGRSETNAKVTVTSDYSFNKVEFGSSKKVTGDNTASTLTIGSDDKTGKLTIADLDLTYGAVTVNDGSMLTLGTVSAVDSGTLTNEGYLLTGISNLVDKDGKATDFANKALKGTGSVVETSITGEYSLEDLKKYAALVKDQELIIKNGTLAKNEDGSNHTLSDVNGLVVFNSTVTNNTTTASVTKDTTVGALAFTDAVKGKDVTISGDLQLTGVNGEIITGVDADKTITISGTSSGDGVMFGAEDDDLFSFAPVSVNNKVSVSDNSKLTTKGTVTFAKAVELNGSSKIEARNGVFTFDSIKGGSVYNDGGSVIVKNAAPAAATGKSTAAETVTYDKAFALDTQYAGDKGAFFTFGQNKASKASTEALIRQYDENLDADDEIGASLYVSERYDLTNGGIALGAASAATAKGTLSAVAGSYIVLDMGSIASKNYDPKTSGVFQGVTSGNGSVAGTILLTDLTADGFVKDEKTGDYSLDLGTNVTVTQENVITDADFYKVAVTGSTVTLSADQEELDKLKDLGMNNAWLVEHDIKEMTNSGNFFANALIYGNEALDAYYDNADAEWAKIAEAGNVTSDDYNAYWAAKEAYVAESEIVGSNMAVFGGAFTTALDVNDQVTAAVSRRTSAQRAEGFTPWVDVFGTTNEAKRLYGNGAGYEADIYGAVLGFDYTAACGGTLGVAFNVGQADSNSVGTGVKVDNDADFYGFSLYGAQTFGDFNVKADLGYTQISNDLSSTGAFGTVKESLDSNVFTFGLGTEYLAKFGALNITPHAGIRLSRIDMDDSQYGADYDTMTVYQLPLGVAFSGNFDVNGWKLAPMVDLSVVPAFGDKDAVASFYSNDVTTRVVDTNPIQATLGVSAQNGAWTFGLNYGLTAGGDDRMNNAFNANLRYSF